MGTGVSGPVTDFFLRLKSDEGRFVSTCGDPSGVVAVLEVAVVRNGI
jgi:hypothetical protein